MKNKPRLPRILMTQYNELKYLANSFKEFDGQISSGASIGRTSSAYPFIETFLLLTPKEKDMIFEYDHKLKDFIVNELEPFIREQQNSTNDNNPFSLI